jgi:hypothetical protein
MEQLIINARAEKNNGYYLSRIEAMLGYLPAANSTNVEEIAIHADKSEAIRALAELWPMDAGHTARIIAYYMNRFGSEKTVDMLLSERNGKCRMDYLESFDMGSANMNILIGYISNLAEKKVYLKNQDASRITELYEKMVLRFVKSDPMNQRFDGFIALNLENSARAQEAFRIITSALDGNPNDQFSFTRVANILATAGRHEEASELFEQAWRETPARLDLLISAAKYAEDAGEKGFSRAERLYLQLLKDCMAVSSPYTSVAGQGLERIYKAACERTKNTDIKAAEIYSGKLAKLKKNELILPELRVTLTWNEVSDLDLHVKTPEDAECDYTRKQTDRGGKLNEDVRTGRGPEIYTLTKLRPGKHLISVNYFAGTGVAKGTVEIVIYEGTEKEMRITNDFTLEKRGQTVEIFSGELK